MNFARLIRPEILALKAYESARGSAAADGILLNANEAPESLLQDPHWDELQINRYPAPQPEDLRRQLSALYGVDPQSLLITRGSDEGIDLLLRVFCQPGRDAIIECPPCFGMYRVAAQIQGAIIAQVNRDPVSLRPDLQALEARILSNRSAKLVFLTSPNNPTGDSIDLYSLKRLLDACGERSLLVLDEAYVEFSTVPSAVGLLKQYPQLVLLRTLSKAFAAAGLRCGSLIAHPEVIGFLRRVMAPYPLSAPSIAAALQVTAPAALARQQQMLARIATAKRELLSFLGTQPWIRTCWPGDANFVLVRVDDGPALVRHCAAAGVRIRDFSSQPLLANCVRLTIGSADEMDSLRTVLGTWRQAA